MPELDEEREAITPENVARALARKSHANEDYAVPGHHQDVVGNDNVNGRQERGED